jgi:TrmH family RNA methyltransferase
MTLSRNRELLIGRLRRRKTRQREGLFLAEGLRCAESVLDAGNGGRAGVRFAVCSPDLQATTAGAQLVERLLRDGVEIVWVEAPDLLAVADTESPRGVLLVCEQPKRHLDDLPLSPDSRVLVLDGIQDPGNVGTLLRVAAAFALDGIVVAPGTADPWNPKSVRASAGLILRVPIVVSDWPALLDRFRQQDLPVLVAGAGGDDVADLPCRRGWALVMGNEAAGPSVAASEAARGTIAIPMAGDVDSLNVGMAGAILTYVLTRSATAGGSDGPAENR